jgi:YD repeat-containing protein
MLRIRRACAAGLFLATFCLGSSGLFAASPPRVKQVRVGLPAGRSGDESGRSRNGAWAPVAVTLTAGAAGHPQDAYRLRIETKDVEELSYQYTVPVPAMAANSERTVQGYIVPGSESAVFLVEVETADGRTVSSRDKITRDPTRDETVGDLDILFLAAGGGLAPMKRTTEQLDKPKEKEQDVDTTRGRRQFAFAEDAGDLPDRWFGYDAVDVVVLATGKADFVNQLAQDAERREALLEWVRRGGQLVISVARNQQTVAELLKRVRFIDVKILKSEVVGELKVMSQQWCKDRGPNKRMLQQVETAKLQLGPGVHVLVKESSGPLIVQASCGLGRVVLVGFDLDLAPFLTWDGQEAFWARLQNHVAPSLPVRRDRPVRGARVAQPGGPGVAVPGMVTEADYDMRGVIKRGLETFEEVPVISFGWVALFILFYIVLVGPLDYFLLKKVFKRLELTWITFPLTVLVVSVLAYFTAFSMKGDDLRINKIDLVDVDMHGPQQAYGHSWFTLFSPRAQSYTVGIEPAVGTWTAKVPERAPGPVVTLLEGGDRMLRQGSPGLFSRPYEYAEDATGLVRVPVPVWSTRSFTASWRAPLRDKKPPVGITDDSGPIRLARDGSGRLVGRLTNNLPTLLKDVCLFYENQWYYLGDLAPDEQRRIEDVFARDAQGQRRQVSQWFKDSTLAPGLPVAPSGRAINVGFLQARTSYLIIKPMMFSERFERGSTNPGLRSLDQSWRLDAQPEYPEQGPPPHRREVILVARTPMLCDLATEVTDNGATPARLWLGELPGPGRDLPAIRGVITQETFLRIFIPVQSAR